VSAFMGLPRPDEGHPVIEDLVSFVDGHLDAGAAAAVERHVSGCAACRELIAGVAPPLDGSQGAPEVTEYEFEPLVPLPVTAEPGIGEVWQLDWENDAAAVLILERSELSAVVTAVTQEGPRAESTRERIDLARPPVSVWVLPVVATVPLGVFRCPLGWVDDGAPALRTVIEATVAVDPIEAADSQPDLIADLLDRLDLTATVRSLGAASWIPDMPAVQVSLRDVFEARGLRPSVVADLTGIPVSEVTALVRRARRPTDDEAAALSAALDVPAERLRPGMDLPVGLIHAIERPVHRASIEERAVADGISEAAARFRTAEAVHAMPARTTPGERDVDTWSELIGQYLDG